MWLRGALKGVDLGLRRMHTYDPEPSALHWGMVRESQAHHLAAVADSESSQVFLYARRYAAANTPPGALKAKFAWSTIHRAY